mgnify:FL=1
MNYRLALGSIGLTLALLGGAAYAENPEHMRQLLTTGDCPGCDLSGTLLDGLNLQDTDLQGANLSGSRLRNIDLTRADLSEANLSGVHLSGTTNLTGANLQDADLSNATNTFICSSSLYGYEEDDESCITELMSLQVFGELCAEAPEVAETLGASFDEADICSEEGLANVALYSAYYSTSQLFLKPLQLRGANLSGANLKDADLPGADLSYATLTDVEAEGADLSYARLFDTDVTGLLNADISSAWDSWASMGEWLIAAQLREAARAQRATGKMYIGAMGRAQQAYYLETETFSTELSSLGIGIPDEDDLFRYGVVETDSAERAVQYALSKTGDNSSFIGVVSVETDPNSGEEITTSTICESESMEAIALADLPAIEAPDGFFNCPPGWKLI